jgi:hypothetical protein
MRRLETRSLAIAWFGIAIALLLPLFTSEFKASFGLSGPTWHGFTLFGFIVFAFFAIKEGLSTLSHGHRNTVDFVANEMERRSRYKPKRP